MDGRFQEIGYSRSIFELTCHRVTSNAHGKNSPLTALIFLVFGFRLKYTGFPSCVLPDMLPKGMYEEPELEVLGSVSLR